MSNTNLIDLSIEELTAPKAPERVAVIRTSDRINFKACRRRWGWQSHLKGNLNPKTTVGPLWFGTAIHFALEDYHGVNVYGHPTNAFKAYVEATSKVKEVELPPDFVDLLPLGEGMMNYYTDHWLRNRNPLKTYVHNGLPQTEVNATVSIDMSIFPRWLKRQYDQVFYSATFDRVIEDDDGQLWIVDYKTAKQIVTTHFQTDPQVSAYCWLGNHLYGRPIAGLIYMQFRKDVPDPPRMLANGSISVNKQQLTTHSYYRAQIAKIHGPDSTTWPLQYVEMLNHLAFEETPDSDKFIRRDYVTRNQSAHQATGEKIIMEIEDMLDPTLPLYPNETRNCTWCPFLNACLSIDDGSDFQQELEMMFNPRPQSRDTWRIHLPKPQLKVTAMANQSHQQALSLLS